LKVFHKNIYFFLFLFSLLGFSSNIFCQSQDDIRTVLKVVRGYKSIAGERAKKLLITNNMSPALDAQLRTWYRIPREKYILAVYNDVNWYSEQVGLTERFEKGTIFTEDRIYTRINSDKIWWAGYEFFSNPDVLSVDDKFVYFLDAEKRVYRLSVEDSEITPFEMKTLISDIAYSVAESAKKKVTTVKEKKVTTKSKNKPVIPKKEKEVVSTEKIKVTVRSKGTSVAADVLKAMRLFDSAEKGGKDSATKYKKAFSLFYKHRSAPNFSAAAQKYLGNHYIGGYGVTKNEEEAVQWYRKSAAKGYPKGLHNMGYCYFNGIGVSKDYAKAVEFYMQAANKGLHLSPPI